MEGTRKLIEALLELDLGNRLGAAVLLISEANQENDYQAKVALLDVAYRLIRTEKQKNSQEHYALVTQKREEETVEEGGSTNTLRPEEERESGFLYIDILEKKAAGISRIASALYGVLEEINLRAGNPSGSHSANQ